MKKYGLQLRVPSQHKRPPRPPPPKLLGFMNDGDEDEDNVEKDIARQATKNKSLKDIEEQHKKALQEDPSVFDYDGVYDEMKQAIVRPRIEDKEQKKSKYIETLKAKSIERERQQEIVYERKIAKERSIDDHLYADNDKYVTNAYKKKLAERNQWLEEEKLRELKEQKDDVTKKSDLSDFYFNLNKNVAFGGKDAEMRRQEKQKAETNKVEKQDGEQVSTKATTSSSSSPPLPDSTKASGSSSSVANDDHDSGRHDDSPDQKPASDKPVSEPSGTENQPPAAKVANPDNYKRKEDEINAARERAQARKRAKLEQQLQQL
ncbi:Nuclear speckle splicing regulatory protein 1 [Linum grandiflorum]